MFDCLDCPLKYVLLYGLFSYMVNFGWTKRGPYNREPVYTDLAFMLCVFYAEPCISRVAISSGRARTVGPPGHRPSVLVGE